MSLGFVDRVCLVAGVSRDVVIRELKLLFLVLSGSLIFLIVVLFLFPKFLMLAFLVPVFLVVIAFQKLFSLRRYLEFVASLGKEELYSSIAMLVLSLLGSWTYVSRVLERIFPATAKLIKLRVISGPKLIQDVRKIIDTVVYRDGFLPHVARDKIVSTIRNTVESTGMLVEAICTSLSMLYVFYIIANFISFLQFSAMKPSTLLALTVILTFVFALAVSSRTTIHDYAMEELKEKLLHVLAPTLLSLVIALLLTRNISIGVTVAILSFSAACLVFLKRSVKLDKIDHAIVWDHVINLRVVRGCPIDQTLRNMLGRDTYELYIKTYPFSSIRNLVRHIEEAGDLGVISLLRQLLTELFDANKKVVKVVTVSVLVLAFFAVIMLCAQTWYVQLLYPTLLKLQKTQAFSTTVSISGITLPIVLRPRDLIYSIELTAGTVPPVIAFATFLMTRAAAGTTRAARITLIVTIILLALQLYLYYSVLPSLA